jgi:CO dehydrogenase/acetyl-CoA synthase beta subunit
MGLFDRPLGEIRAYIEGKYIGGTARELPFTPVLPLADSTQVILSEDTGMELGNPGTASRSLLLWDSEDKVNDGRITLLGPDFPEADSSSLPFAQVIIVSGRFSDEYDCYRDLRDATYNLRLRGFMTRVLPGRQSIWCRISKEAVAARFNAQILGSSLIQAMKELDFVDGAEVLLVTSSKEDVEELAAPAEMVLDIVEALIKMYEEMNFDCESCEYEEVCDSVVELRNIREKLQAENEREGHEKGSKGVDEE